MLQLVLRLQELVEKRRRAKETYREYRKKKEKEFKQKSKLFSQGKIFIRGSRIKLVMNNLLEEPGKRMVL